DLGFVGDVAAVDPTALHAISAVGMIPVVAGVAAGPDSRPYNVNADAVAGAMAAALGAAKVIYLTNVAGLLADPAEPDSLVSRLSLAELDELLASGAVQAGMIPKLAGI